MAVVEGGGDSGEGDSGGVNGGEGDSGEADGGEGDSGEAEGDGRECSSTLHERLENTIDIRFNLL